MANAALEQAAKGDLVHAERDLLRLFRSLGMSFAIRISHYMFGQTWIPHLKVRAWWTHLLKSRSENIFGGFRRTQPEATLAMSCFWKNLKGCVPDHAVFTSHADRLLPFYLFMDEGVGLRKSGVLVISMQAVLGSSTASTFYAKRKETETGRRGRELDAASLNDLMTDSQSHNAAGNTYNSRFLYTVLPKKVYKNNDLLDRLLNKIADECICVLSQGIQVGSEEYYPVCLGLKGDAPMLMRIGNFTRGFSHMGKGKGCCWECQAGEAGLHFEDVRLRPCWERTVYTSRPYTQACPLLRIPARPIPEKFFRRDPFHTFKQSIGCSFLSSSIVVLCELGYFPGESEAVQPLLTRAYEDFAFWTKKEWGGRTMQSLKNFTKDLFHWPRKDAFPAGRFKGGDCMLMLRWLQHLILHGCVCRDSDPPARPNRNLVQSPLEGWHARFLDKMLQACQAALQYFHIMHRRGIWLRRETTHELGMCAVHFTQAFSSLAKFCHARGMPRYHLVPSLHAMHHFWIDAKQALTISPPVKVTMSPGVQNCEADEDFVGKIARLTRKVHARSTSQRTLERYLVKLWCEANNLR